MAEFLAVARQVLRPGGCLAVVLPHTTPNVHADLVIAAHRARLGYLQHIVGAGPALRPRGNLRVHTDILALIRMSAVDDGDD